MQEAGKLVASWGYSNKNMSQTLPWENKLLEGCRHRWLLTQMVPIPDLRLSPLKPKDS